MMFLASAEEGAMQMAFKGNSEPKSLQAGPGCGFCVKVVPGE